MEKTLRVTGRGKLSVTPDTTRILITQESVEDCYEEAVACSAAAKQELNDALTALGFARDDLKTLSFQIDTKYESYQTKDRSWRQRLLGYEYTHRMKLEFASDRTRLGLVLEALSRCVSRPHFTVEFTVADPEPARNELLARAVADSRAKAEVLSSAAGVALGRILSIDYSWGELDIAVRPMMLCEDEALAAPKACAVPDIEADDISMTDTVTVVWELD